MSRRTAVLLPWLVLATAGTLYGVAFAFPAAALTMSVNGAPGPPWVVSGPGAFSGAFAIRSVVWLANPLFWGGLVSILLRLWLPAGLLAVAAFWLAGWEVAGEWIHGYGNSYLAGYWLWAGGMAFLAAAGLAGWWLVPAEHQTRPAALWRGWRKVPTVLVPVVGVTVQTLAWVGVFDGPPPPAAPAVTAKQRTVAGVTFEVEEKTGDNARAAWTDDFFTASGDGRPEVVFRQGKLTVGGRDHGGLAAGDAVRVKLDGTVTVNGVVRGPVK